MQIGDVVAALRGFADAYGKIASGGGSTVQHRLRVSAIKSESFELVILAWVLLGQTPSIIEGLEVVTDVAKSVVGTIVSVIRAKKFAKGQTPNASVNGNGNVVLMLGDDSQLEMSGDDYRVYAGGFIDSELQASDQHHT